MAFVYQSKRDFKFSTNENLTLGPGAYIGHREIKFPKSEIPFQTTSIRDTPAKVSSIPGPGTYINTKQSQKVDQFGRIRCSSSFASLKERFGKATNELNPGPGSYSINSNWNSLKRPRSAKTRSKILKNSPSVPSIPNQSQAFGYEETESGDLVCQKNPTNLHTGIGTDSVGPGQYNPQHVNEIYGGKGTTWHKSASKRELASKGSANLGPGSYADLRPRSWNKLKSSAAFADTCKRESYIPVGEYEEFEEKDGNPGPGNYFLSNETNSKSENEFQKFGSGSKRFKAEKNLAPGPGYYKTSTENRVIENKAPFASSNSRFVIKVNSAPGPGSYKSQNFIEAMQKKTQTKKNDAFGCTEKRFPDKSTQAVPGPGEYDTKMQIGIHNTAKQKPSAVFESGIERIKNHLVDGPAPGSYDIPSAFDNNKKKLPQGFSVWEKHEIGKETKEDKGKTGKKVSKALGVDEMLRVKYVDFETEEKREKDENGPGPGAYFKKAVRTDLKDKRGNVSKVDRFQRKDNQMPGPCDYYDGNNLWNKKTFNIKFTEFK